MKPFHYHEDPMYAAAAAILAQKTVSEEAAQLDEGVEDIVAAVANFKKGDKTNFGVVTDVGSNSITFKAKDLPVTKIPFNHRKMGSKDFTLDQLVKLKEAIDLEEAEIKSDKEFIEYSKQVLKAAHGDKYDDEKAMKTAQGILDKSDGDYGAAVGMLTSGLSEGTMGMGTATITAPGNKLHGKQVRIFHKFADGRLNVQYVNSNKKGDLWNMTLTKDQYKLD
jgi:hypothetical protein